MDINNQQTILHYPKKSLHFLRNPFLSEYPDHLQLFSCDCNAIGKVAIKCQHPLDVIKLDEHGYHNGFSETDEELSEITCDALKELGVSVLVYFSDAMGADFNVTEAKHIAKRYGLKLCEVNLPFKASHLGAWRDFQWLLFDKRLSSRLTMIGAYNERYQA